MNADRWTSRRTTNFACTLVLACLSIWACQPTSSPSINPQEKDKPSVPHQPIRSSVQTKKVGTTPDSPQGRYVVELGEMPVLKGVDKTPLLDLVPDLVLRVAQEGEPLPNQASIVPLEIRHITREDDGGWVLFAEKELDWARYRFRIESSPTTSQIVFSLIIRYSSRVSVAKEALRFRLHGLTTASALAPNYKVQEVVVPFVSSNHTPPFFRFDAERSRLSLQGRTGIEGIRLTRDPDQHVVDLAIYNADRRSPKQWPLCQQSPKQDVGVLKTQEKKDYVDVSGAWVPGEFRPILKWRYQEGSDCLVATAQPSSKSNPQRTETTKHDSRFVDDPCKVLDPIQDGVASGRTALPPPLLIDTAKSHAGTQLTNLFARSKHQTPKRSYFRWRANSQIVESLYFRSSAQFPTVDAFRKARTTKALDELCLANGMTFATLTAPVDGALIGPHSTRSIPNGHKRWETSVSDAIHHLSDLENVTVDYPSSDTVRIRNRNQGPLRGFTLLLPTEKMEVEITNGPAMTRHGRLLWGDLGGRQELLLRMGRDADKVPIMNPLPTGTQRATMERP